MKNSIIEKFAADAINAPAAVTGGGGKCGGSGKGKSKKGSGKNKSNKGSGSNKSGKSGGGGCCKCPPPPCS